MKNIEDFLIKAAIVGIDEWWVSLPHSCDEWVIAGGTQEETLNTLDEFINQVQEVRAKVARGEQQDQDWK